MSTRFGIRQGETQIFTPISAKPKNLTDFKIAGKTIPCG